MPASRANAIALIRSMVLFLRSSRVMSLFLAASGFPKNRETRPPKIAELKKLDLLGKKKKVVSAIEKIKTPIVVVIDDIADLSHL